MSEKADKGGRELQNVELIKDGKELAPELCDALRGALNPMAEALLEIVCEGHANVAQPLVDLGIFDNDLVDTSDSIKNLSLDAVCAAATQVVKNLEGISSAHAETLKNAIETTRKSVQKILADQKASAAQKERLERRQQSRESRTKIDELLKKLYLGRDKGKSVLQSGNLLLGIAIGGEVLL